MTFLLGFTLGTKENIFFFAVFFSLHFNYL
jgi:hypothetical protein